MSKRRGLVADEMLLKQWSIANGGRPIIPGVTIPYDYITPYITGLKNEVVQRADTTTPTGSGRVCRGGKRSRGGSILASLGITLGTKVIDLIVDAINKKKKKKLEAQLAAAKTKPAGSGILPFRMPHLNIKYGGNKISSLMGDTFTAIVGMKPKGCKCKPIAPTRGLSSGRVIGGKVRYRIVPNCPVHGRDVLDGEGVIYS